MRLSRLILITAFVILVSHPVSAQQPTPPAGSGAADGRSDTEPPRPPGFIPSLDATVTELRFFESGHELLPRDERVYDTRFAKATTRSVYWELNLEHPGPGRRVDFEIEAYWYRRELGVKAVQSCKGHLEPDWKRSHHSHGRGWKEPGRWQPGIYLVEIWVAGQKVLSGSFKIDQ